MKIKKILSIALTVAVFSPSRSDAPITGWKVDMSNDKGSILIRSNL